MLGEIVSNPASGVVIDSCRSGHRRQVMQIFPGMLVALHIARGESQQFFGGLAVIGETGDPMLTSDRNSYRHGLRIVLCDSLADTLGDPSAITCEAIGMIATNSSPAYRERISICRSSLRITRATLANSRSPIA